MTVTECGKGERHVIMQNGKNAKSWFSDVMKVKIFNSTLSRYNWDKRRVVLHN